MSRFRFIAAEKAAYPIARLCRVLEVSRAGYYAWRRRGPSAYAGADATLTTQMRAIHTASRGAYGAPRVHAALAAAGIPIARKRVARLLRAAGLRGQGPARPAPRTTVADPAATPAPNLVARDFRAAGLNTLWVGDITYIPTAEGWLYLAVLLDVCSRRVVGWAMADHLRTELALDALQLALQQRSPARGTLVHHTDGGCQYTAHAYQAALAAPGIRCSMSQPGQCLDNALVESFNATINRELVHTTTWPTRQAARQAIFGWITVFYNRQRLHSALGYRSPLAVEGALAAVTAA